jgi:hypothetical protein
MDTMLTCPMCKKKLRGLEKACANCRTDVSLLVDYVENLRTGLVRAQNLTRAGELGDAVWEYLEVLEVDPDNAVARRQVGKVATAVRQFDQADPVRREMKRLQRRNRFRRWLSSWTEGDQGGVLSGLLWFLLVAVAFALGYTMGQQSNRPGPSPDTPAATDKEKGEK